MSSVGRLVIAALLLALVAPAATGAAAGSWGRIAGEVIALDNEGEFTEIQVRTRDRVERWLRLGTAADYGERFRVGDRVRARVIQAAEGQPALVSSIQNRRSGERVAVRAKDGRLLQLHERDRSREQTEQRAADRTRQRDRVDTPGTAGRSGSGSSGRPRDGGRR